MESLKLGTLNKATFRRIYLGTFENRRGVYVNVDVTMAIEFWTAMFFFSKFAFSLEKQVVFLFLMIGLLYYTKRL